MTYSYENFNNDEFVQAFKEAKVKVDSLRRCTKCILPETFPYITFDEDGVCNYCHNYKTRKPAGLDALQNALEPYEGPDGSVKCIVSFSGGRDSSFALHFVKKVLGLDAMAFTYDWGVASEIARRNQIRMCEKLGVEQIMIKANLNRKRANIKANLEAWLKKPDLGTIPILTSVGQHFFYHANQVAKRLNRDLIVIGANPLELTYFKTGFSGIKPPFYNSKNKTLDKINLAFYYLGKFINNPAYINRSLFDTLGGYLSFFIVPHNYLRLYEYIKWDEDEVNNTLVNEYDWEISDETPSTWRIDDGTVPVSDYMYYMMSGLTINDTFRSNQIREGQMTREQALEVVNRENQPRFKAIQWYCEKIGVDFESTVRTINNAPRLYE
jgi:hypothetical protein